MKKLKWILLFIMILLASVFLFATCKKTKAYDLPQYSQEYELNDLPGYGNGFSIIYEIADLSTNKDLFSIQVIQNNTTIESYGFFINNIDSNSNTVAVGVYDRKNSVFLRSITLNYNSNLLYVQFLSDTSVSSNYQSALYFNFISIYYNRLDQTDDIFYLNNNDGYILDMSFSNNFEDIYYNNALGTIKYTLYWQTSNNYLNGNGYLKSFVNFMRINYRDDYTDFDFDEQIGYVFSDNKPFLPVDQVKKDYQNGYNAGYNTGYLQGETAGYNTGFNQGYSEGYQDGQEDTQLYQNGYNAGYTAGYSDGEMSTTAYSVGYDAGYNEGEQNGYRNGYQTGYLYGYEQGQAGENAITPAFSVISGVFGVVASVMSIQLFPGITIGLLILVPLFFAVLGLILWIWRRN